MELHQKGEFLGAVPSKNQMIETTQNLHAYKGCSVYAMKACELCQIVATTDLIAFEKVCKNCCLDMARESQTYNKWPGMPIESRLIYSWSCFMLCLFGGRVEWVSKACSR